MKRKNNLWLNLAFLLLGALISYFLCQFQYLQIDTKVNIASTLISVTTAIIGLYLAVSLKKIQTKSSNLHNYLQPKLDLTWGLFLSLSHQLSLKDQIELKEVTKAVKEITHHITPLKKMFSSFGLIDPCIDNVETKIENLENFLVNDCTIKNNIINYAHKKGDLRIKLDEIHTLFVSSLKVINEIS
jgi:hypothetical protein